MDKILGGQKVLYEPKGQNQWPQWKSWKIRCPLRVRNISQWAQGPQQRTDVSHWSPQCIIQLFNKHFLVPTDCQAPNYADAQQRKCISCLQGQKTRKKQERQERQDKNTNNFSERLKVTNTPPPKPQTCISWSCHMQEATARFLWLALRAFSFWSLGQKKESASGNL